MPAYHYALPPEIRAHAERLFLAGYSVRAAAQHLGCKASQLRKTRERLIRDGKIVARRRKPGHRPWTTGDETTLAELIDQGYSYDAIARKLNRTREAVLIRASRRGVRLWNNANVLTATRIAALLGIADGGTVTRWITRYGLRARKPARNVWSVAWLDLMDWLEDPNHWMAYDPARVTEATLREHLTEIRQGQPRWLTVGEVQARYHVAQQTVNAWIARGHLPAVKYGNHYIRESDLEAFTPPYDRPRMTTRRSPR